MTDVEVCVDHDHEAKKVRALVHRDCNWLIGWIENHPELVQPALNYVDRFKNMRVV